jgi:hypothetical protein
MMSLQNFKFIIEALRQHIFILYCCMHYTVFDCDCFLYKPFYYYKLEIVKFVLMTPHWWSDEHSIDSNRNIMYNNFSYQITMAWMTFRPVLKFRKINYMLVVKPIFWLGLKPHTSGHLNNNV